MRDQPSNPTKALRRRRDLLQLWLLVAFCLCGLSSTPGEATPPPKPTRRPPAKTNQKTATKEPPHKRKGHTKGKKPATTRKSRHRTASTKTARPVPQAPKADTRRSIGRRLARPPTRASTRISTARPSPKFPTRRAKTTSSEQAPKRALARRKRAQKKPRVKRLWFRRAPLYRCKQSVLRGLRAVGPRARRSWHKLQRRRCARALSFYQALWRQESTKTPFPPSPRKGRKISQRERRAAKQKHAQLLDKLRWHLAQSARYAKRWQLAREHLYTLFARSSNRHRRCQAGWELIQVFDTQSRARCPKAASCQLLLTAPIRTARKRRARRARKRREQRVRKRQKHLSHGSQGTHRGRQSKSHTQTSSGASVAPRPRPWNGLQRRFLQHSQVYLRRCKARRKHATAIQAAQASLYLRQRHLPAGQLLALHFLRQHPKHWASKVLKARLKRSLWRTPSPMHRALGKLWLAANMPRTQRKNPQQRHPRQSKAYRRANLLQQAGLWVAAAQAFYKAAHKHQAHPYAPQILWRAIKAAQKAQQYQQAARWFVQLMQRYPRWDRLPSSLLAHAKEAEARMIYQRAMRLYRWLHQNTRVRRYRHQALWHLARLSLQLKRFTQAAEYFQQYAWHFPRHKAAPAALLQAARLHLKHKRWSKTHRLVATYLARYQYLVSERQRMLEAHGMLLQVYNARKRSWRFMREQYRLYLRRYNSHKHLLSASARKALHPTLAYVHYHYGMLAYNDFLSSKVDERDPYVQRRQLAAKVHELETARKRMAPIFATNLTRWQLCARYQIARGQLLLSKTIDTMPLPQIENALWTPQTRKLYRARLHKTYVAPLRQKASRLVQKVLTQARKTGLWNKCAKDAKRLQRHLPRNAPAPALPQAQALPLYLRKLPLVRTLNTKTRHKFLTIPPHLRQRCQRGSISHCYQIGLLAQSTRHPKGRTKAKHYYRVACLLGHAKACYHLGRLRRSPTRAAIAFYKGCHARDLSSCLALRKTLRKHTKGQALLLQLDAQQRACQLRHAPSCTQLVKFYAKAPPRLQATTTAHTIRKTACQLGDKTACQTSPQRQ